jgi:hypothetical protein
VLARIRREGGYQSNALAFHGTHYTECYFGRVEQFLWLESICREDTPIEFYAIVGVLLSVIPFTVGALGIMWATKKWQVHFVANSVFCPTKVGMWILAFFGVIANEVGQSTPAPFI